MVHDVLAGQARRVLGDDSLDDMVRKALAGGPPGMALWIWVLRTVVPEELRSSTSHGCFRLEPESAS